MTCLAVQEVNLDQWLEAPGCENVGSSIRIINVNIAALCHRNCDICVLRQGATEHE